MTPHDLREEIAFELQALELVVSELQSLSVDVGGASPSIREQTAAAAFLAQFYNGIENILKRVCAFYTVPLPVGDTWHIELFQYFVAPTYSPLPELFDESLAVQLSPYRRFRHVVFHSYGFQLDWTRMVEGIDEIDDVFLSFRDRVTDFLGSLPAER